MNFSLDRDLLAAPRVRIALMLLALSVILVLTAFARAVRIEPLPPASSTVATNDMSKSLPVRALQVDAERVVETDIFAVDRSAPAERYPMPGEERGDDAPVATGPPSPKPNVLGTGVALDGALFATVQIPNTPSRIVRIGDRVGTFTVVAITRGTVTFRAADAATFQVNAQ